MSRTLATAILVLILILMPSGLAVEASEDHSAHSPEVEILYSKGVSLMPMLLVTGQVDGYIAWQPYASLAEECGTGRIICLSRDLPPRGNWIGHPCCVFVARDDLIRDHMDLVSAICALNIYASQYVRDNPSESADIAAQWMMGGADFTFGDMSISSRDLMRRSSPTLAFSTDPSREWRAAANMFVYGQKDSLAIDGLGYYLNESRFFDFRPLEEARAVISRGAVTTPRPVDEPLGLGCLAGDQHSTPLFVAVKRWRHFNDTYGIALKPLDEGPSRPGAVDLMVNGDKVARLNLISAPVGAQLMTLMEQECIHIAYLGIAPAIGANLLGGEVKVIQSTQNEGSGLVVSASSPARDWEGFVSWARERHSQGRPLRIADPQVGSIQDFLLRYALNESGLRAVLAPEP